MDEKNKIERHKKIYLGFLILALIGIIDMGSRTAVSQIFGYNGVGFVGFILVNITKNRVMLSVAEIFLDFWIFWLIIALFERQVWIKLKYKDEEEQKQEEQKIKSNIKINYKKRIIIAIALVVLFVVALIFLFTLS